MDVKDILGLGQVSEKLIDVISKGIGNAWNPIQIVLEAKAKSYEIKKIAKAINSVNDAQNSIEYSKGEVKLISEKGNYPLEVSDNILSNINNRTIYQQIKKQKNLEQTILLAHEELISEEKISNEPLDDDWITRFFNIAEDVSNEQLQHLWGRILAGEVKKPQSFSLRTLEVLRNLSPLEAEIFRKVSMYAIINDNKAFLIDDREYLKECDISFSDLLILNELGLISSNTSIALIYDKTLQDEEEIVFLCNSAIVIKREKNSSRFMLEVLAFTTVGKELLQLIQPTLNENYINYIVKQFRGMNKSNFYRASIIKKDGEQVLGNLVKL